MPAGRPAKNERSEFGERLFIARTKLNLTQVEAAKKLGVPQQLYTFWERKALSFTIQQINDLCDVLKVTPNHLFGREKRKVSTKKKKAGS